MQIYGYSDRENRHIRIISIKSVICIISMLFKYKAVKDGKVVVNQIQAENDEAVLRFLKTSDYFPVSVKRIDKPGLTLFEYLFKRVSFGDVVNLTRQLAIMLNAGLTLVDSLDILKKQSSKPAVKDIIEKLDKEIRGGNRLSSALAFYPQYFSSIYIALVRSGEASGKLSDIFLKLADNMEKEREFRGKLTTAMVYPAIVVVAMLAVMFIMISFVVPKLLDIYKDFEIDLPFYTQMLILVSSFFNKFWPIILVVVGGLLFASQSYLKTKTGKYFLDSRIIKTPVIGNVIKMSVLVDATRTLATLIAAGVSMLEGLTIIEETSRNVVYQDTFKKVREQVEKGVSLGQAMKQSDVFPPILVQMTQVGEQTGHLDETLSRISKYFEIESEMAMKTLTTLIEPTILLVLGVAVAFLVMAVITPLYTLTSAFQ